MYRFDAIDVKWISVLVRFYDLDFFNLNQYEKKNLIDYETVRPQFLEKPHVFSKAPLCNVQFTLTDRQIDIEIF